ncbi:hypothetical protein BAY60_31760 [Prauserella muralis]|uniref:Activator of Hsp90 ATPase homologue 1/2-like C-terminal domain-containing protein n=1 Tax=Prauserella muralis TaxID=588067 RepID=A0A2V4AHJ5_9PSEU|nr:hypothetical protein BAY60_31760 [Prauserella muralis]
MLRFERRLAHPPEKVWRAVTEPAELAHWFPAAVSGRPAQGATLEFGFGESTDSTVDYSEGTVTEFDPPRVFEFRWAGSTLRFEVVPDGEGSRLLFSHTLDGATTAGDRPSAARQAPGWDACLAALAARLDGHWAPEPDQRWFLERAERYVEAFGLGRGEVRDTGDGFLLRFERDLVQDRDTVWAALAEGDEPAIGEPAPVRFTHGYVEPGEVIAVEPRRIAEYGWRHDGEQAGRVRVELREQEPVGTRLVVTQTVPHRLAEVRATLLAAWQTHLELLFAALHGDVRCPWPAERTERLRADYARNLRAGAGVGS